MSVLQMPYGQQAYIGQAAPPPDVLGAVANELGKQTNSPPSAEFAQEAIKAAGIIAASSAVPVVGTAGGAVVAAAVILGPRLFKGIASLFGGRENPWPGRVKKIAESNAPPAQKIEAAWALQQLAQEQASKSHNHDTVRWARGAMHRAAELWASQLPLLPPDQRARYDVAPAGREQFVSMPLEQLQGFVSRGEALLANRADPFWQNPQVRFDAVAAQLQAAKQVLAERSAPPKPTTTPAQWMGWLATVYHEQANGLPVTPPPPIPELEWPAMPKPWADWLVVAQGLQRLGQPVPLPPGVKPEWVPADVRAANPPPWWPALPDDSHPTTIGLLAVEPFHTHYRSKAEAFGVRDAYLEGLAFNPGVIAGGWGAVAGAYDGTRWLWSELRPHLGMRPETQAFTMRQAYGQGLEGLEQIASYT